MDIANNERLKHFVFFRWSNCFQKKYSFFTLFLNFYYFIKPFFDDKNLIAIQTLKISSLIG